ncbi:chitin deacetylase 8 isoform X2 [Ixodes scapularis]|uniref:chitin deacetylase 8 isoform X2 n=1 Tax=Ixodes scapularis TaxID=6945 RepID=UPI001C38ED5E|nr:chitin deacetylase 8 isoform X2 [Ixodes scapularis]
MPTVLVVSSLLVTVVANTVIVSGGDMCGPETCKARDNCLCATTRPPNNLTVTEMPQFVTLSFDGAVNWGNMPFYRDLLAPTKRKNKRSGCNIGATFFVSHEYVDYPSVHELHHNGHEIALRSISDSTFLDYWKNLSSEGWKDEIFSQRALIAKLADVPASDIVGMRAPLLVTGGDNSYRMINETELKYDSSLPHLRIRGHQDPVFPYTLDYGPQTACVIPPCPELRSNFMDFYGSNKAPFPIFLRQGWLRNAERNAGFLKFLDWLLTKDDVFVVTIREVIKFMRNPRPLRKYQEDRCHKEIAPSTKCTRPVQCIYKRVKIVDAIKDRWVRVCASCPGAYPWVGFRDF